MSQNELDYNKIWEDFKGSALIFKEEGQVLFDIASNLAEGSQIVEIGSFEGRSSSILAAVADAHNLKLVCIDAFIPKFNGGNPVVEKVREVFYREVMDKFENVELLEMISDQAIEHIVEPIDYIFIDGDHTFDGVWKDLNNYMPLLKDGHCVTLHDYNNAAFIGVQHAFEKYSEEKWPEVNSVWNLRTFRKPYEKTTGTDS